MYVGPFVIGGQSVVITLPMLIGVLAMIAAWFGIFLYPIIRILRRTGHSGWWILLLFVPVANIVGLQILAYGRWPALQGRTSV